MVPSPVFCSSCGAANQPQDIICFACQKPLQASIGGSVLSTSTGLLAARHLLKQRYCIIRQVGQGGMGAVYQAEDTQLGNRLVAVKEMSQSSLSQQELVAATEAFKREAHLLAGLSHPNLPSIYDHFDYAGRWYLVMSFIEGETLEDYLDRVSGGKLSVEEVLDIGKQLCGVLDYLHTRPLPIIFRDLKPANVMRTPRGHLYLIDFGIARHFKPGQVKDTTALGSAGYAAPEQYGKAQTTSRSDIYSLGVILHQALSGNDPLTNTPTLFDFPPLNLHSHPAIPELQTLITQMLDKHESKRPESSFVMRELQRIATGQARGLQLNVQGLTALPSQPAPVAAVQGGTPLPAPSAISQQPVHVQPAQPVAPRRQVMLPARQVSAKQGVSRRAVIAGLAVLGVVGAGGGITWLLRTHSANPPVSLAPSLSKARSPRLATPLPAHLSYTYRGHTSVVTSVAWSPDGTHIASCGGDATVQIWNAVDGSLVFTNHNPSTTLDTVAWSPDGTHIASGGTDKMVQVWDATNGKQSYIYTGHTDYVNAVAWSPDGKRIASASSDRTVQVWDAANGGHVYIYRGHTDWVTTLSWSPDGKRIASSGGLADKTVQVWDAVDGSQVFTYKGHADLVSSVAWSPDGMHIASGSFDKTVQVWNASDGSQVLTLDGHSDNVFAVAWSPDGPSSSPGRGSRIASGSADKTAKVWDASTGNNLMTYRGHSGWVNSVAWSPDGQHIVSGSEDLTAQVWDAM